MELCYHNIIRGINSIFYIKTIMRIRAITIGQNIPILYESLEIQDFLENKLEKYYVFYRELIEEFRNNNIPVDSKRICSQPLINHEEQLAHRKDVQQTLLLLHSELEILQKMCKKYEIDYFACCTMLAEELKSFGIYEKLLLNDFDKLLKEFPRFFTSLPIISKSVINLSALKAGTKIIKKLSEPDPLNNLRFCISCNVPANTPFFPAAYHKNSEKVAFSIAIEMADEVINIFQQESSSMVDAINNLKRRFNEIYDQVLRICEKVNKNYDLEFTGMDFSPASYPQLERSIGSAIENLGIEYFGSHGTLLGVALITNSIPKKEKIIGFSGFMQPVLEDFILAKRVREKRLRLEDLLLYSTVCGTGLDCVPLPGDITERELFHIILDLGTISILYNKPLTARLMPIPDKFAGDDIEFDFEYFSSSKVMDFKRLIVPNKKDLFRGNESSLNFELL
ncbi:MAG: DUF711 family protein [Promethearchaeota archaeon]|nr:MAG: DUF711 family protein [Candidatus Lokiarchaeota archaeon]